MTKRTAFSSRAAFRAALSIAFVASTTFTLMPACSGSDDFTAKNTGGATNTGGSAGDASTTGGSGGAGGSAASGGVSGSGGEAGVAGFGGVSGSGGEAGAGGAAGSGGEAGADSGSGKADGKPCANKTECKSGYCVDDVCCESDCAGLCSTCKASGKEGLCTSYAANTDPEGECVGAGTPTDPCAGTCDGKSACTYPSGSKSCAAQVCSSSVQSNFACSGAGACVKANKPCGNYQCSGASCLTQCSADAECISTTYCKAPTCDLKLDLGKACPKPSACKSGICFGGTCCNATCGANFECSTGSCKCNGQTCDAGQACVLWYQDSDNDGFGNAAKSILGCANKKPAGYVADKTDCYDANADAKPGQTQWFPNHRGDGKFDYNCDDTAEQYYKTVSGACQYCSKVLDKDPPCNAASYDCWCDIFSCTLGSNSGLSADGPCGTIVTLKTCTQDTAFEPIPGGGAKKVCVASAHANSSQTAQLCR